VRLAVIGDVHHHWDAQDVALLDAAGYDLIVFVGDLAGLRLRGTLAVARAIATLTSPVLVVPGNHDAPNAMQLLGEMLHSRALIRLADRDTGGRRDAIAAALGEGTLAGYSRHPLVDGLELIAARPHSMGGPTLSFAPYLSRRYGVESMEDSAQRLIALVDASPAQNLLFVGHNGPTGLGARRDSIWGCDFKADEGDFGDPDLRAAIDHARATGRRVVGVVAGHMHRRLRGGGRRTERVEEDGVLYVNAARVPRIWSEGGVQRRHHVALTWDGDRLDAQEVIW